MTPPKNVQDWFEAEVARMGARAQCPPQFHIPGFEAMWCLQEDYATYMVLIIDDSGENWLSVTTRVQEGVVLDSVVQVFEV